MNVRDGGSPEPCTTERAETWLAVRPETLQRSNWGGDEVVFHAETGDTHLLNALPLYVLESVSDAGRSTAQIHSDCTARWPDEPGLAAKVVQALHMLEDAELIEPVAPRPQ